MLSHFPSGQRAPVQHGFDDGILEQCLGAEYSGQVGEAASPAQGDQTGDAAPLSPRLYWSNFILVLSAIGKICLYNSSTPQRCSLRELPLPPGLRQGRLGTAPMNCIASCTEPL